MVAVLNIVPLKNIFCYDVVFRSHNRRSRSRRDSRFSTDSPLAATSQNAPEPVVQRPSNISRRNLNQQFELATTTGASTTTTAASTSTTAASRSTTATSRTTTTSSTSRLTSERTRTWVERQSTESSSVFQQVCAVYILGPCKGPFKKILNSNLDDTVGI